MNLKRVDICCGLAWGDEAKGKIVSALAKSGKYDMICRWGGGNNAGHTIYIDGKKYKTHLIPAGVFYNIPSIIGPDCVVNQNGFIEELNYLKECGFNTNCIKISPKAHVITDTHIEEDIKLYRKQGSTAKGIAPCYRDKYARFGTLVKDVEFFKPFLWDEKLYGTILCEGAQGVWLDITQGNYPYTTSSTTLPYGACSLGFPPQLINTIYGAAKIYDTRAGNDPDFPDELHDDPELIKVGTVGNEIGTTTGRTRTVNWLNITKLIQSINMTGSTVIIISKIDILKKVNIFKLIIHNVIIEFKTITDIMTYITDSLQKNCPLVTKVVYSDSPEHVTI
jgi:adenylosuccinate synthase